MDTTTLLRGLGLALEPGPAAGLVTIRARDGAAQVGALRAPVERVTSRTVAGASVREGTVFVGRGATRGVLERARSGEFGLLVESPAMLVIGGKTYSVPGPEESKAHAEHAGRPAWIRWAVARVLALAERPLRQGAIAELVGASQQSVSLAARHRGPIAHETKTGLEAASRVAVLEQWAASYPGAGGQRFGWYSLDSPLQQVKRTVGVAGFLGVRSLVSGDVAADLLAPWKMPASGLVYIDEPVDLEGEGFVPVPLSEASLVTVIPRDPTVWRTAELGEQALALPVADAALVYADLLAGHDLDSAEAAQHLKSTLMGSSA